MSITYQEKTYGSRKIVANHQLDPALVQQQYIAVQVVQVQGTTYFVDHNQIAYQYKKPYTICGRYNPQGPMIEPFPSLP